MGKRDTFEQSTPVDRQNRKTERCLTKNYMYVRSNCNAELHFILLTHYSPYSLQKQFKTLPEFESFIPLETQPRYATIALVISLIFIFTALGTISGKKSHFIADFFKFTFLSLLGSLFFGIATVFLTNSFGVYA